MTVYTSILKELGKDENMQLKKDWNQEGVGLIPKSSVEKSKSFIDTGKAKKDRQAYCDSDREDVFSQSENTLWTQSVVCDIKETLTGGSIYINNYIKCKLMAGFKELAFRPSHSFKRISRTVKYGY